MARVIEAVQIFKKVEDVTAAKDEPSPVYLMDELADMARGSIEASEKISDRIAKRLQNKSPVVKFKALRLIRHIVNKGCGQFQRSMQRHASIVREHMHFKGEPDPYKGDTLNQRVRDAAKEASDSLFNTVMAQPVNSLGSRIQGFGSSAALQHTSSQGSLAGGAGTGGPGSRTGSASSNARMVGFGSSTYTAPAAAANGNGAAGGGSGGYGSGQRGVNRPLTGGYGNDAGSGPGSSGGYGGGYNAPAVAAVEVLGSEDQLVESICTPGGMRLAPDVDDLRRFVEAVGALDGLRVAELLRDKMDGSGSWQQLLRALYALEAVLLQGATQACGEIAVLFQSDPGPVQAASGHPQAAVRERAARVLKLLLGGATASAGAQAAAPPPLPAVTTQAARPQTTADLLGGLDMLGSPVHAAQPPQQQLQPAAGSGAADIFSGLAVPATSAGSPQAFPGANTTPAPATGAHAASYGHQQPQSGHQPQQPYQQPNPHHHAAGPAPPRPPADPFDLLQSSPYAPSAASSTSQAHPPMPMPQQHQPLGQQHGLQPAYGHPNTNPNTGGGGGVAGGVPPPFGASAPMPGSSNGPAAGHPAHAAAPRAPGGPLDEMFADMSLSGSVPAGPRPGGAGSANAYGGGPGGGGAYGYGAPGPAYGGGAAGATGYSSNAAALGGLAPSGVHLLGSTGAVGPASRPAGPPMFPSGSGVGAAFAAGSHYGAGHQGDLGGSAVQQAPPSMHAAAPGELLGGFGAPGVGAAGVGSQGAPGAAPWPAGMGAGGYGGTAGSARPGVAAAMGTVGASASASSTGVGMGNGAGGSMMVGPGGQVRYVGGPGQGGIAAGGMGAGAGLGPQSHPYGGSGTTVVGGGMGMAMGTTGVGLGPQSQQYAGGVHAGPGQGGWQQGYPAQQPIGGSHPQHHMAGASQHQPQQQRGGAAFDFVLDQFK